jgi:phage-related protein
MQTNKETWSQRIDRYIAEGRTVSGGCGPSQAIKNINNSIQSFSDTMVSEAKTIFGDASSMFNTISNAVGKVIAGGPNQQGWGAGLASSVTAGIVNAAATAGRNVKSALGSAIGAIGGGNTVAPSGAMANVTANALENVEAQKTQQEEQATVANYQQGNANYNAAIAAGEKAPSMFDVVDKTNANAMSGLTTAASSQAAMDKAKGWWESLVMGGVGSAESGFQNLDTTGGSTAGEQGNNFLQGMFGMSTGGGGGSSSSGGGGGGGLAGIAAEAAMFA